jgi:transcriptional regulator with XRE-family HTH domain
MGNNNDLKMYRKAKAKEFGIKITLSDLSLKLGFSIQYLSQIENNMAYAKDSKIELIKKTIDQIAEEKK